MTKKTVRIRSRKSPVGRTGARRRRPAKKRLRLFKAVLSLAGWFMLGGAVLSALALGAYMVHLDTEIRSKFEGKRWALPARVYARPLELFPGATVDASQFADELQLLRYRAIQKPKLPGSFSRDKNAFEVVTRRFDFWDGAEESRHVRVTFANDSVAELEDVERRAAIDLLRIEPAQIAGIYPSHQEDRILVKREQIPPVLVDALLAVEDRSFYEHFGINPKGIARAMVANWRAGRTVQGGSTLTQQLVKNYFLSNERTYSRKINEMLMAFLLDWHYGKDDILEAYANEVYLGQDGGRAIHGLGLASRFYFDRPLAELELHHIALLVGLVRGPSQYDPRRYPERAKQRRGLVLDVMVEQGLISANDAAIAQDKPLDVSGEAPSGVSPFPAFLDLVQRQLRENYREEDLTSEGLKIFTSLDPIVQNVAEKAVLKKLPELEKIVRLKGDLLQAAVVVVNTSNGEVQAVVGGRDVRLAGFNRALDAKRPAGSSIKTAVFLTALEYPQYYTLATQLDDSTPIVYSAGNGKRWEPKNYDKRYHGQVMLRDALARSYNVATARLGLELDVMRVLQTIKRLGIERDIEPYPSLLLGAIDVAPIEIAQMYETFASGGYSIPLRTIREVTAVDGRPLERKYQLTLNQVIEPGPAYLITKALQRVVQAGTASSANQVLSRDLGLAGKTGTTDDYRDSWFSGFSGNTLTVVWLGRDDNKPTKLSGSKGALQVWIELMKNLDLEPLELAPPPDVEQVLIDPATGYRADRSCANAQSLPFIVGSAPQWFSPCSDTNYYSNDTNSDPMENFFRRLLE